MWLTDNIFIRLICTWIRRKLKSYLCMCASVCVCVFSQRGNCGWHDLHLQSFMLRVSWNPGRHSQEMPPFCVSLQMCAQPWFLSMQVGPSFEPSGCAVKEMGRPRVRVDLLTATWITRFLKEHFSSKAEISNPLNCSAFYTSTLFWCELSSLSDIASSLLSNIMGLSRKSWPCYSR